ncbi:MAG: beta-mannanase [Thermoleophilia bacterium]|nr:beta-mannanase [Thermoleophilia bacterium]MCZ4495711.1 beta-mannanase [Thermoleophilia bacterium]
MEIHIFGAIFAAVVTTVAPVNAFGPPGPPGMPPKGTVMLGVGGSDLGPVDFDELTGATHDIHLVTTAWDEGREDGWTRALIERFRQALRGDYRLMVHIGPMTHDGEEGRSPGEVARGVADQYLLDLGRIVNESGQYLYVRPPGEMNGSWSPWSAFDADGAPRDADHAALQYRRAFIRIAEIVRGGSVAQIDRRLVAQGMPPLDTDDVHLPRSGRVALVWNPQSQGSPNVRGNQPADYYPGRAWVDYVANDMYAQRRRAAWATNEAFYEQYATQHPYMMAEWAPWELDDPAFVTRMFDWVATHPRTVALIYYHGTGDHTFHLTHKPDSLAAYRRGAAAPRYRCPALSSWTAACVEP